MLLHEIATQRGRNATCVFGRLGCIMDFYALAPKRRCIVGWFVAALLSLLLQLKQRVADSNYSLATSVGLVVTRKTFTPSALPFVP